jgi:hypothetical protein
MGVNKSKVCSLLQLLMPTVLVCCLAALQYSDDCDGPRVDGNDRNMCITLSKLSFL